jgi:predicted MFS family arabinose efflux permease
VSDRVWWLFAVQVFAGAVWAAHELGVFLMYFETIREDERTSVLTKFNLLTSLSMAAGTVLGGWLLDALGAGRLAYACVFLASVGARAASLLLLWRLHTARTGAPPPTGEILSAASGVLEGPVAPSRPR